MTRREIIGQLSIDSGLKSEQAEKALDSIVGIITGELISRNSIRLQGLGTFKVAQRKARNGRNPRTGESIEIPAQKIVQFKAGKKLNSIV